MSRPRSRFARSKARQGDSVRHQFPAPCPHSSPPPPTGFTLIGALNQHHFNHPTAVSDQFFLPDHSIKDIGIIPLELCNSHWDGIRKAHEGFLISKGETLESYGMNRRDEYGNLFIQIFVYCISPPITFYFYICFILNTVTVYSILT